MEQTIQEKLQAPYPLDDYEWRVKSETNKGDKVFVLCYVTARAIQSRLDEIFGPFGWKTSYHAGPCGGVVCELSCKNPDNNEWVSKEDVAENTHVESIKGGFSSALKRAAVPWGIGRSLYKLKATYVPLKQRGEHSHQVKNGANANKYMYWDAPELPAWAVEGKAKSKPAAKPKTEPAPPDGASTRKTFVDKFYAKANAEKVDLPTDADTLMEFMGGAVAELKSVRKIRFDHGKSDAVEWVAMEDALRDYSIAARMKWFKQQVPAA